MSYGLANPTDGLLMLREPSYCGNLELRGNKEDQYIILVIIFQEANIIKELVKQKKESEARNMCRSLQAQGHIPEGSKLHHNRLIYNPVNGKTVVGDDEDTGGN